MAGKITITINPKNWTATVEAPDEWTVNLKPFWNGKGMHMTVHAVEIESQPDPDEGHRARMRKGTMAGLAAFAQAFAAGYHADVERQPFVAQDSEPDDSGGTQGVH